MNSTVPDISVVGLILAFVPTAIVIGIMWRWKTVAGTAAYATARMLVQLLLIGYVLIYIFESDRWFVIAAVLAIMLLASSFIAVRPIENRTRRDWWLALAAISTGGVLTLAFVTQLVVGVEPWFSPRYVVPLAGMIFANSMNAVSLAAERLQAESQRGTIAEDARRAAFKAAMIPTVNSMFAVGLVALPGMMTGQILSGVSPLIAAEYQIVVMTMLFGGNGISAAAYLMLQRNDSL